MTHPTTVTTTDRRLGLPGLARGEKTPWRPILRHRIL